MRGVESLRGGVSRSVVCNRQFKTLSGVPRVKFAAEANRIAERALRAKRLAALRFPHVQNAFEVGVIELVEHAHERRGKAFVQLGVEQTFGREDAGPSRDEDARDAEIVG